jgi:peptide/nickel transport system permease protein
MGLKAYVVRRLLYSVVVMFALLVIMFTILLVMPGDPVVAYLGEAATPEQVTLLRQRLGLDQPPPTRFFYYVSSLIRGELGMSLQFGTPVADLVMRFFPATLEVSLVALFIALVVGLPLGITAAINRNKFVDYINRILSLVGVSMPSFWIGILLLLLAVALTGTLPMGRYPSDIPLPTHITGLYILDSIITFNLNSLIASLKHILLPGFVLSLVTLAQLSRMIRSRMIEEMNQEYVLVAMANGMPKNLLIYKYALRKAFSSTLTVTGMAFGMLLGGAYVVEYVFAWPGMGFGAVRGLLANDTNLIISITLVVGFLFIVINLVVDVLYGVLDPRVRYQ